MSGEQMRGIRESLGLSVSEFAEALSLAEPYTNGSLFVRRWESSSGQPSGTATAAIKYLRAIHEAVTHLGQGDATAAQHVLEAALPAFMR